MLYTRFARPLDELALARGDGPIAARLKSLAQLELLILDDWGFKCSTHRPVMICSKSPRIATAAKSTVVTSQLDVASWHHAIGDNTYADAILDRFLHNAHRVELAGDSLRRVNAARLEQYPFGEAFNYPQIVARLIPAAAALLAVRNRV